MAIFWILIFKGSGGYIVTLTSAVESVLHDEPVYNRLLYIRMFTSMPDAIGHKLYLEGLSAASLLATILSINPAQRDIRPFIESFHAEGYE